MAQYDSITDPQPSIRLPQTRRWDKQFSGLAGFMFVVFLPITIGGVARGDWGSLFFVALPLVVVFLGRGLQCLLTEHYVILHSDRLEFPCYRGDPRKVAWVDVQAIRWPENWDHDTPIVLIIPADSDWPNGRVNIDLKDISPADRWTLIRYLRMATLELEQTGWPQFCHKRVIPLMESLRCVDGTNILRTGERFRATGYAINWLFERLPFVGGALCPLLLILFVSRKTWWTLATIIAVSGVVNIRLVWRAWIAPFSEICFGTVAAMLCAGFVSGINYQPRERTDALSSRGVITSLSVGLIGLPLLGNAMALGWVQIPKPLDAFIPLLFFTILFLPALMYNYRKRQIDVGQARYLEDDAIRRWDEYVKTGHLPDGRFHELARVDPNGRGQTDDRLRNERIG